MARQITIDAMNAFMNDSKETDMHGVCFKRDNTIVTLFAGCKMLYLHNNRIAERNLETGEIKITNAGWQSNTTKERLNGIPGVSIVQRKGVWFLNGKEWDGSWIQVN